MNDQQRHEDSRVGPGVDPTPAEIDFLEQRLYEFNSQATARVSQQG